MKIRILILTLLLTLLIVIPVAAKKGEPVGFQISVFDPPPVIYEPAGQAFHVIHGWKFYPKEEAMRFKDGLFLLTIDGVEQTHDAILRKPGKDDRGTYLTIRWLFNEADGMYGEHIFEGSWLMICGIALEDGLVESCDDTSAWISLFETETVVIFE
jgi:hypothetical protein